LFQTDRMWTLQIIEKLGGRAAVAALVRRKRDGKSSKITCDTVRMWIARNSIPGYAMRQLIGEAERRNLNITEADFRRVRARKTKERA